MHLMTDRIRDSKLSRARSKASVGDATPDERRKVNKTSRQAANLAAREALRRREEGETE